MKDCDPGGQKIHEEGNCKSLTDEMIQVEWFCSTLQRAGHLSQLYEQPKSELQSQLEHRARGDIEAAW